MAARLGAAREPASLSHWRVSPHSGIALFRLMPQSVHRVRERRKAVIAGCAYPQVLTFPVVNAALREKPVS